MSDNECFLISIIITVYNLENYIEKCVKSVCGQSYSNLQIIIVDDGSTDRSLEICNELAQKDRRIVVIHQSNKGAGAAKNLGLKYAKGEYIGFVDGDDFIQNDMYESLIKTCLNNDADISWCGRNVIDEKGTVLYQLFADEPKTVYSGSEVLRKVITWDGCDSATWDKLFKKDIWNGIAFQENSKYDDLLPSVSLVSRAKKIAYVPDAKYNYLIRDSSVCHQKFRDGKFDMYKEARNVECFVDKCFPLYQKDARDFVIKYMYNLISEAYKSDVLTKAQIKKLVGIYKKEIGYMIKHPQYWLCAIKILIKLAMLNIRRGKYV